MNPINLLPIPQEMLPHLQYDASLQSFANNGMFAVWDLRDCTKTLPPLWGRVGVGGSMSYRQRLYKKSLKAHPRLAVVSFRPALSAGLVIRDRALSRGYRTRYKLRRSLDSVVSLLDPGDWRRVPFRQTRRTNHKERYMLLPECRRYQMKSVA